MQIECLLIINLGIFFSVQAICNFGKIPGKIRDWVKSVFMQYPVEKNLKNHLLV